MRRSTRFDLDLAAVTAMPALFLLTGRRVVGGVNQREAESPPTSLPAQLARCIGRPLVVPTNCLLVINTSHQEVFGFHYRSGENALSLTNIMVKSVATAAAIT
jgi:hypothetical protein